MKREQLKREQLLRIFKLLLPLCKKEKEYGGLINLRTGEFDGLFKGDDPDTFPFILPKNATSARQNRNWVSFHTHQEGENHGPSKEDVYCAHYRGAPDYIIAPEGIYEVKPKKVLSIKEVKRKWKEVVLLAKKIEEHPYDTKDAFASLCWKRLLEEILPTEITILLGDPLVEPSSNRVVTANSHGKIS